jgi:hypothetical protein
MHPVAGGQGIPQLSQHGLLCDLVHLDRHLRAQRPRLTGRRFQLGDGAAQRRALVQARLRGRVADLGQHPQRDQQRARLIHGQPERAVHRLGLADHDLAALVGQVDRAVGVR